MSLQLGDYLITQSEIRHQAFAKPGMCELQLEASQTKTEVTLQTLKITSQPCAQVTPMWYEAFGLLPTLSLTQPACEAVWQLFGCRQAFALLREDIFCEVLRDNPKD